MTRKSDEAVYMRLAITEAKKSKGEDNRTHPNVGVVVVKNNEIIGSGFRGQAGPGAHAEYGVLEELKASVLAGATVYTTLEPCTSRNHPKIPCASRLIERKISRVVVGMLDPNQVITGKGILQLRRAGIAVDLFPADLMAELEELNRDFIREHETATLRRSSKATSSSDTYLSVRARRDFRRPDHLFEVAQSELLVVGINLEVALAAMNTLMRKVNAGVGLRILCFKPDGDTLVPFSTFSGVSPQTRRDRITSNIELLRKKLRTLGSRITWELRVVDTFFSVGVIATDIATTRGCIIAQSYLFTTSADEAPTLTIYKKDNEFWYHVYHKSIEALWNSGVTLDGQNRAGNEGQTESLS